MLETTRLKLVPLTHEQLLLYKNDPKTLAENLKVNYIEREGDPKTAADLEEAIEFWLAKTQEHAEYFQWYTNWEIILKEGNVGIGGIGFAGVPDTEGKSMIGYGLDIRFHEKGYATEALHALLEWGFKNPALKIVIADSPLENIPSHKVLIKNGFSETGRDDKLIHWKMKP
jgi:ribosomal-protein-alanine N-acetyltransferase